ncbi:sarcalumenin [Papilio machaon]|uniref:sarcalumenin n=1 Tax=Papilio machaon TaxID=76193 RepID=UPI001E664B18|nr:sarcalumenin [Papilio machaon]XP_014364269.2 sarcalumenin [Papilio machaon]
MWTERLKLWRFMLCALLAVSALALLARADDDDIPLESQCRPYIEKALKELESGDTEPDSSSKNDSSEVTIDDETKEINSAEDNVNQTGEDSKEDESSQEDLPVVQVADEPYVSQAFEEDEKSREDNDSKEDATAEADDNVSAEEQVDSKEDDGDSEEQASADEQNAEKDSGEIAEEVNVVETDDDKSEEDNKEDSSEATEAESQEEELGKESEETSKEGDTAEDGTEEADDSKEEGADAETANSNEDDKKDKDDDGSQEKAESDEKDVEDKEDSGSEEVKDNKESKEENEDETEAETEVEEKVESDSTADSEETPAETADESAEASEDEGEKSAEADEATDNESEKSDEADGEKSGEAEVDKSGEVDEDKPKEAEEDKSAEADEEATDGGKDAKSGEEEELPEEELLKTGEIPENLRSRDHIIQILRLDEEASEAELIIEKSADIILRDLKRVYENSIKPLEGLYKYRDLSNRHFGDPEIFSKPLVLFMGPWSGGKSSILNYLTGLEFTEWSLRTGAEPSPAYFNILMHGKDPEVLDGTQLAADWTFSGLQKFGQGLEERLRGLKYPSKLLEKVNIVEIPGILEVRKQVSRVFPFNDACQWFIDRADIIFLVYDPSKLDVGPETEAILDQLKGRESQTRIVLNKADTVKPEELMRVQSALIWNISPLMSSAQPPVMYTVSLWSMPFEASAPARLLLAQERELLRDLRQAVDRRIENKIASARRFAVRVRNHAKMVDCYLTTYYNHKTIFGNKKLIADAIIENPQNYHIYEGLSTLTNISRYDLPDPETYRDFFRLNPLYEFQQLSATCTYFRGCPITRLDVAIAYDLPELVGKYKKMVETATPQGMPKS